MTTNELGLRWGLLGGLLLGLAPGCGSDEGGEPATPETPFEELSPARKLMTGLGGDVGLNAITGFQLSATGFRYLPNEGFRPDSDPALANTYGRVVSYDLAGDALKVETTRQVQFLFPLPAQYTDTIQGNLGTTTQGFLGTETPAANLSSDKVAAIRRQEMLLNPHALVNSLMDGGFAEDGDEVVDGVMTHRLSSVSDVYPMILSVDQQTGHLVKIQTQELDYYRRDVSLEVRYSGWQSTESGVPYPATVSLSRAGEQLLVQQTEQFRANPSFPEGTFEFPAGASPQLDPALFERGLQSHQWYFLLDSIGLPFTGVDTAITPVEVSEGVHQLQGGSHHSFLVEQSEGLVLVDAPLHDDRGAALSEFLSSEFDKPITHVVASHFHEDHVAGIREVLGQTDAALVVHESVERFWRGLLAAPSQISPDALFRSPRDVDIIVVPDDGDLTLDDSEHPVALYDMNSAHANDLLLTHDTASNTVFVVDIYSPGNAAQFGAEELDNTILDNAIDTDTLNIVGGHGTEMHDYDDLQSFL